MLGVEIAAHWDWLLICALNVDDRIVRCYECERLDEIISKIL